MSHAENQKRWILSQSGQTYLQSEAFRGSIRKYRQTREKIHREGVQAKVRAIKLSEGCKSCGFKEHAAALEFHHRNPEEKKFRLSESRNYSWKMVQEEIAKCDILCSNCHAILEYQKRENSGLEE